jgi:hypothetical protein
MLRGEIYLYYTEVSGQLTASSILPLLKDHPELSEYLKLLSGIQLQFLCCSGRSVVTIPTELYRLLRYENKLAGAYNTNALEEKCTQNLVRELNGKRPQDKPRCKWNDRLILKGNFVWGYEIDSSVILSVFRSVVFYIQVLFPWVCIMYLGLASYETLFFNSS